MGVIFMTSLAGLSLALGAFLGRAAHVERLVHQRVHLRVQIELLADDFAQQAPDTTRWQNEQWQDDQREQRAKTRAQCAAGPRKGERIAHGAKLT